MWQFYFLFWTAATSAGEPLYRAIGGKAVLTPESAVNPITGIVWKHGLHIAMEWYGKGISSYRQFTDCGKLNTSTGALTITRLTREDSGIYTAEINYKLTSKTELLVISPVPKPELSVRCEKTYCVFTCNGNTAGAEPVTYHWWSGDMTWPSTKEHNITEEEKEPWFRCEFKNPVSYKRSEKVSNPFIKNDQTAIVIMSFIIVLLILVVLILVVSIIYYKYRKGKPTDGTQEEMEDMFPESQETSTQDLTPDVKLTDGRCYQWQLNDGSGWLDIVDDYIIEAHYSLPKTKDLPIYITPHLAEVRINFNRMSVDGKNLKVRRLDDGNTAWIWYYLSHEWIKYGDQDSEDNPSPVKSSDIEEQFQSDPSSSFTFSEGAETFEITFTEMQQVGQNGKKRVIRRPLYQEKAGAEVSQADAALRSLHLSTKPRWQFLGDNGGWCDYTSPKCSVTSDDIERTYRQNPRRKMPFKVKEEPYLLDFKAMMQTNLKSKHKTRNVRRVWVSTELDFEDVKNI